MNKIDWEKEKERIKKESLEKHERLHKLFVEDRLSFERERKRMIDEVINSAKTEKQKAKLRDLQKSWDNKMKKAGSKQNRFVLARYLLMKHLEEVWNPSMREFCQALKGVPSK